MNLNEGIKGIEKVFLVFNTACLGDVLLCNSLIQNIKADYPDSKVVFITDKPFKEAALYQFGVDDVVVFDKKKENHGIIGILKFLVKFKYKKPYASFITYHNERNYLISRLLGSKKIFMASNKKYNIPIQHGHNILLENLTGKSTINYPIRYNIPKNASNNADVLLNGLEHFVILSTTSKKSSKDIPLEVCADLVRKFNNSGINVVFSGVGDKSVKYSQHLIDEGCNFLNLVNKTTIAELAAIIKKSDVLISVDTGTMHLGTALNVPTLIVWYENNTKNLWMPNSQLYKVYTITENQTADNIYNSAIKILDTKSVSV